MHHIRPYLSGLSTAFQLSDEERYALIDIVRYGDINAAGNAIRDALLMKLSEAAVLTLYGDNRRPMPDEIEAEETDSFNPGDCQLAVKFFPIAPLPLPPECKGKAAKLD